MKKILFGSILLFFFLSEAMPENRELRPYRLINADQLNIDLVSTPELSESEYLTKLSGNVHFFYGETEFFADRAEIYEIQKIVRMFGNVRVFDDSLSLYADEAVYKRLDEELVLNGNVNIHEDHQDGTKRTFYSDEGQYLLEQQLIYAFQNIEFYDERENIRGYSHYLEYRIDEGYGLVLDEPRIYIAAEDTLSITAEQIEFYRDYNRIAATFNVETEYDEYRIESDFLLLFTEEEYALFIGEPRLVSDMVDARAESFYIYFEDRKIKSVTLENDTEMLFSAKKEGAKTNKINSVMIDMFFTEGNVERLHAYNNVRSYYTSDDVSRDKFINYANSDDLFIKMNDENEIESIAFSGKVSGNYLFSDEYFAEEEEE
jgi:lipopolysaccharide assembly outer membrane protein LptD (OstA)